MTMPRVVLLYILTLLVCGATKVTFGNTTTTVDEDIRLSKVYGGPHGFAFSDMSSIKLGQTLSSITVRGAKRIDAISVQVATPAEANWDHGGSGGKENVLVLDTDEYVDSMEIHWGLKSSHTRVFYLKLSTNDGNSVSAGTKANNRATVTAPKGFQLSGFFGRAAGEVDRLGAIWTRIAAKPALLKDTMGTGWYGKRIRNWVGPTVGAASDTACYRQTEPYNSNKVCPAGYSKNGKSCVAQCPLAYPVKCFLECIPQNDDCTLEITQKTVAVVAAVVNVVTAGVFGAIASGYQQAKKHFMCAANIVGVIRSLIYYIRFQKTTAPQGAVEEILAVAYQSDVVVVDLPVAVCNCLGLPVPPTLVFTGVVMMIVEAIVKQVITNGDEILSSAQNVYRLLQNASAVNSTRTSVDELQDFLDTNSTCGYQLKHLTDRVVFSVNEVRNKHPSATIDDIRVKISGSSLVLKDIPTATNNCMNELLSYKTEKAAFKTRDLLRKTFGVIVDQLIEKATTDMGKFVAETQYILETTNLGLTMLAGLDPTRIIWLASQFVQPTCGPTAFIGEIDDGSLYDALGLTTVDEAFVGSYGTWSRKGDGVVNIIFTSIDTKDVTVVVHSGGEDIAEVAVGAGKTVTWNSTVSKFQDRVLYLDRWRPNLLGISGSGGGSLKLWVPRASKGGHLTMHVRINMLTKLLPNQFIWVKLTADRLCGHLAAAKLPLAGMQRSFNLIRTRLADLVAYPTRIYFSGRAEKVCLLGYAEDPSNCITQCPMSYPVVCCLKCIPQNDDCSLEIFTKAASVAAAVFNAATAGVFNAIFSRYKSAKQNSLCNCLGTPVPAGVKFSKTVLAIVETIVKQAITNGDQMLSSATNVMALPTNTGATDSTTSTAVDELQDLIASNSTCGYQLKNLTDHAIFLVNELRNVTPNIAINGIRVDISSSSIVLNDIPTAANNCMGELLSSKTMKVAFQTRDLLRNTFGAIIDQLIETATTDLGASEKADDYMLEVANMGLTATCGPTSFLGDIDDGTLYDALGLPTIGEAFEGSYGTWTKEGDGIMNLIFESTDTKDVTVVIHSGGDAFAQVDVDAGKTVVWKAKMSAMQGTVMYLDRWRSNMAGIPGSGGGSLVLWIPHASRGGHLTFHVRVNAS